MKKSAASRRRRQQTRVTFSKAEMLQNEIRRLRSAIAIEFSAGAGSQRSTASGINAGIGDISEEYVPELLALKSRVPVYDRMANDPWIRGQLRGIGMTLVSGVRWNVIGGTQEQQDLLGANILRQGPPKWWASTSWYDRLHETLGMLIHGFAAFALTRA